MAISDFGFRPAFAAEAAASAEEAISDWRRRRAARRPFRASARSALRAPRSAFTLMELMVAIGLMALMMYMISTIFTKASGVFNLARATVEVHQNARAAYGMMLNDFAAAKLCEYEDKVGYFGFGWERTGPSLNEPYNYTPAVTFTTLADQSGARPLVPGVTPQLALVRYCLEWDGGQATLKGDDPLTALDVEETYTRPTYRLIKRVRFPQLPYYFVDMNEFSNPDFTPDEVVVSDMLAMGVVNMRVRVYYKGDMLDVSDCGHVNVLDDTTLIKAVDGNKKWLEDPSLDVKNVRILAGSYAPQDPLEIGDVPSDTQLSVDPIGYDSDLAPRCSYRIENGVDSHAQPEWIELQDRGFDVSSGDYLDDSPGEAEMLPMRVIEYTSDTGSAKENYRMPYIVEITLELTDSKSLSQHTFCERFHIPSSEY